MAFRIDRLRVVAVNDAGFSELVSALPDGVDTCLCCGSLRDDAGERVRSFTIITTAPNGLCARLHNRMPAILKPAAWPTWLGEKPAELPQIKALLDPYPAEDVVCWPVSAHVANMRNNDPGLVEPIVLR
jgi:putative SOS response-associated peptidase YedK